MTLVIVIITIALFFDFLNGFHDSANSIATVVATRVLTPRKAVLMAAIATGTYLGGWKIVKTMATKLIHLRPFEGFCAETSSAATLFVSAHFGIPVSTTHVINGSIIGVGATENYKKVKWITTRKILLAWVLTIPISFLFGAVSILLIQIVL